ncbi:MAG: 4'-phosphopantetheinyl transferase superfamily protein [Acidiferrobacterales bacterium]|nr:4'-phosphopantetheinyl transferase superfamily protein [Acidiferrobacterales bacterium]
MSRTTDSADRLQTPASRDPAVGEIPWSHTDPFPQLLPGEVHLWSTTLDTGPERIRYLESLMDRHEMRRAARYRVELSRQRFICARGILKELLGRYAAVEPDRISFKLGNLGKPYLPDHISSDLQFNSTDTRHEAVFAFCRSAEIGVDIEFLTRKVRHREIAQRKFSSQEHEQYLKHAPSQQKRFFLKIWTRKEAYGKARGVGIRYRLNSVNLVDDAGSDRFAIRDEIGAIWEVVQFFREPDITASVVIAGTGWQFRRFRLPDAASVPQRSQSPVDRDTM